MGNAAAPWAAAGRAGLGIALGLACAAPAAGQEVSGFVQADFVHDQASEDQLHDGTGEPLNEDRFLVRRARLRVAGASAWTEYVVEGSFDTVEGARAGLRHVEGAVRWAPGPVALRLGAGLFRAPFGYEVYDQRDTERLFAERSLMSEAFFPGQYDVGARISATLAPVTVVVAVQNGEPVGSRPFPAADPNGAKDVIGRVEVGGPWGDVEIEAGCSAAWGRGTHPGTRPTKDSFVWRDLNEDDLLQPGELRAIRGAAGRPSETFERWGLEADARVRVPLPALGALTVYVEGAFGANLDRGVRPADPVLLGRDQRALGGYVAVTQELGAHALVGLRADYYRPEIDRTALRGGEIVRSREEFVSYAVAAGLRIGTDGPGQGRLTADYTVRRDPLGLDAAGRPADLRNDRLTVRLQVVF